MGSTFTLQNTVNYAQTTIRNAPLTGVGGYTNEPAFSIGNWVRQFILAAPFAWRWNRAQQSFSVTQGTQDYTQTLSNLGFLEKASLSNGTNQWELAFSQNLAQDIATAQPRNICPLIDTGTQVTFRLFPVPDVAYTVNINYQVAAPNFVNLTDTWAPIPDYFYYLIETGFLAKTYEYIRDDRFPQTMSLFVKQVVAASTGITDLQDNIFATEFIDTQREFQAQLGNSQAGRQGRSLIG
jgi:hypothetical protein